MTSSEGREQAVAPTNNLRELAAIIRRESVPLLGHWRLLVRQLPSARELDTPTLNNHIPALLEELAVAFETHSDETIAEALREGTPPAHGLQRENDGFDIVEVVAEYNILRGCIHDLAESNGLSLRGKGFHTLNLVLDGAIGMAVETFAAARARDVQARREEYLAFVAHDLRTPLSAIVLATKMLDQSIPAPEQSSECSRMIRALQRNVGNLETLVGKVLEENSNLTTEVGVKLERRLIEPWSLVETVIHDLHPVAGTGSTKLINEVPDDLILYADAGLLRRIFQNLIANAIEYSPRGEIRIGAKNQSAELAAECWVSDTGAGIPADALGAVFEKGVGDAAKEGSTGLGLAIVKTFVEAHGGTVHAESATGKGTTIHFTLPGPAAAVADGAPISSAPRAAAL